MLGSQNRSLNGHNVGRESRLKTRRRGVSNRTLPTPYAEDSERFKRQEHALNIRVKARDAGRKFWTRISSSNPQPQIRKLLSIVSPVSSGVLLVGWEYASFPIAITLHFGLTIFCIPALLAASFSRMSARDRLRLPTVEKISMNAYPGVERILNTLDERRIRERVRIFCSLLCTITLFSLWNLDAGVTISSILLGLCFVLASTAALNSIILENSTPMRSNTFPLLSLHAPTLHNSALNNVMTDLLVAHLDPETASQWDLWIKDLSEDVRSDQNPIGAVEHLLQAIHLNHIGLLDENGLLSETRRVFKVSAIDGLISENSRFNLTTLRRLLAHTRAWQPGLFRLADRLQDSVIHGETNLTEENWRLDLDIPPRCGQGQADLFVMIHNHTEKSQTIEVEILSAEGEPEVQTIRIPTKHSTRSRTELEFGDDKRELIDQFSLLLADATILWVGLAWADSVSGPHPIQVTIRNELGDTVESMVVHTILSSGVQAESMGHRMSDAASEVRRIALSLADQ